MSLSGPNHLDQATSREFPSFLQISANDDARATVGRNLGLFPFVCRILRRPEFAVIATQ